MKLGEKCYQKSYLNKWDSLVLYLEPFGDKLSDKPKPKNGRKETFDGVVQLHVCLKGNCRVNFLLTQVYFNAILRKFNKLSTR